MPQHCCDPTYTETLPEYIRICVNQGSKKEMIAIASVGLDDLQALVGNIRGSIQGLSRV